MNQQSEYVPRVHLHNISNRTLSAYAEPAKSNHYTTLQSDDVLSLARYLAQLIGISLRQEPYIIERILAHIEESAQRETRVARREIYQLAWQVVVRTWRGEDDPFGRAFYQMYGTFPERIFHPEEWDAAKRKRKSEQMKAWWAAKKAELPPKKQPQRISDVREPAAVAVVPAPEGAEIKPGETYSVPKVRRRESLARRGGVCGTPLCAPPPKGGVVCATALRNPTSKKAA